MGKNWVCDASFISRVVKISYVIDECYLLADGGPMIEEKILLRNLEPLFEEMNG